MLQVLFNSYWVYKHFLHIIVMKVEEFVVVYTQHVISVCQVKWLSRVLLFGVLAVYLGCMMCFLPSLHCITRHRTALLSCTTLYVEQQIKNIYACCFHLIPILFIVIFQSNMLFLLFHSVK
jgi:hypothetical protein